MKTQIIDLVPVQLENGTVQWMKRSELESLTGLGFFKSKSRKQVESKLPQLQNQVATLTTENNNLTNNVQLLQKSLVEKDRVIKGLQQRSPGGGSPVSQFKNPIVIGSIVFGVLGFGYGIYKTFN